MEVAEVAEVADDMLDDETGALSALLGFGFGCPTVVVRFLACVVREWI